MEKIKSQNLKYSIVAKYHLSIKTKTENVKTESEDRMISVSVTRPRLGYFKIETETGVL